jgi:phenylalanyl-tRNA synthetase alpha chain
MEELITEVKEKISKIQTLSELEDLKVFYLGKSGVLTAMMMQLKNMPPENRKAFGQTVNQQKERTLELIQAKFQELQDLELQSKLSAQKLDLSLPGRSKVIGKIHPIWQAIDEMVAIFSRLGFDVAQGPSIESDWYNFTALNIAQNHPARQMHDTFYLQAPNMLLRTHTSPVQIRTMEKSKPPFRFISFGRTYRADSDMTHTPMFHQIEGVVVDEKINMGHLKATLTEFIKLFFEDDSIEMRYRPSFFPFTEPSAEIDIRMPGQQKWLEVLGSGMVHPAVLGNVNIDPKEYGGFAFGLGVERFAMLKYGIKDLRQFFDVDLRWLRHFGFSCFHSASLQGGLSL